MKALKIVIAQSALLLLLIVGIITSAHAIPITMTFTVGEFTDLTGGGNVAPTEPVSGTIVWDAASVNGTINSLTSIDLTLNGHNYTLAEVDYISPYSGGVVDVIGGVVNGVEVLNPGENDIWIVWNRSSLAPLRFTYAADGLEGKWDSQNFTSFDISAAPVPEPATILLLSTGLAGIVGFGRKRFFKK
jgi:hypothetical protein